jgi:hypothetical protein
MGMPPGIVKLQPATEGLSESVGVIAHYWQTAAPFWPAECEGGDNGVPSDFQGSLRACNIRSTVILFGEEVERRSIMPKVVCLRWLPDRGVRDNPMNLCSTARKARFSGL